MSSTSTRSSLLGIEFDYLNEDRALQWVAGCSGQGFRYLVTPNVDHLVRLENRPELRRLYDEADVCVCDSRVLAGLCRVFRLPVPEVLAGSDLVLRAATSGFFLERSVSVIGGHSELIAELVARGYLNNVSHHNPPMGFISDPAEISKCVDFVASKEAEVVLLAVGSPQQEILANAILHDGRARGAGLCIGASLLFLTGGERRAPRIVRTLHLEWLFRLLLNPRRLARRYLLDGPKIVGMLWRERLRARK